MRPTLTTGYGSTGETMTVKEQLHQIVDLLQDEEARQALDYLRWLASETETLSKQELAAVFKGEEEIGQGKYVTLAELRRSLNA
jgi:hypothetical protein